MSNYYRIIDSLMSGSRHITDKVALLLKPFDITEPQYNVLRVLEELNGQPSTVQEIQEAMYHHSSNTSRIIDKLVTKNLVTRQICETNRRKMEIRLTDQGLQSVKEYNKLVRSFHKEIEKNLNEVELETLADLLEKMFGGSHEES